MLAVVTSTRSPLPRFIFRLVWPFHPLLHVHRCRGVSVTEAVGYAVMAYARMLARAEALIAAGVCLVDTAASVAATSDMVFTVVDDLRKIMVGNLDDVRAVVGCAMADRPQEGARREVHAELQTMAAVMNATMVCGHVSFIGLLLPDTTGIDDPWKACSI